MKMVRSKEKEHSRESSLYAKMSIVYRARDEDWLDYSEENL